MVTAVVGQYDSQVTMAIPISSIKKISAENKFILISLPKEYVFTRIDKTNLEQFVRDLYESKEDTLSKFEKRISGLQEENDVLQDELEDLRAEIQEIKARLAQPAVAQTDLLNISGNCAEPIT